MKNYRKTDYAANKYSEGIVYLFDDETVEITLEDYLREHPDKTEEDFRQLKALSDQIYLDQDRADQRQTRKNVSIHTLEESLAYSLLPLDEEYILADDKRRVMIAADKLFRDGSMTEKQKRRFIRHFIDGKSLRFIADEEGVYYTSVYECICRAQAKLRKYFDETQ